MFFFSNTIINETKHEHDYHEETASLTGSTTGMEFCAHLYNPAEIQRFQLRPLHFLAPINIISFIPLWGASKRTQNKEFPIYERFQLKRFQKVTTINHPKTYFFLVLREIEYLHHSSQDPVIFGYSTKICEAQLNKSPDT